MSLYTRLTDLPVTSGSHVSHAILLDRSRPSKHFGARARIGLWRGVRDRYSTVFGVLALARFRVYLTRVIKSMGAEAQHYQPQRGGAAGHINRRAQGGNLFSIPPSWWQPGGRLPERLETNPTRKRGLVSVVKGSGRNSFFS